MHFLRSSIFLLLALAGALATDALGSSISLDTAAVESSIVFIYPAIQNPTVPDTAENKLIPDKEHPLGTGFLVWIPKKDKEGGYLVIVTARHIFEPSWAGCATPDPKSIFIRIEKKIDGASSAVGPVAYVPLQLEIGGRKQYFTSSNDQVDSAVVPINLYDTFPQKDYGWVPLVFSTFANHAEIKLLKVGDSVAAAGLVPGLQGHQKNYSFFKFGHISSMFEEPFSTGCGGAPKEERVWFIDANLLHGNSGAPIFYYPQFGYTANSPSRAMLIGTQSSAIPVQQTAGMPAGLAAITPIEFVATIIERMPYQDTPDFFRGIPTPAPK